MTVRSGPFKAERTLTTVTTFDLKAAPHMRSDDFPLRSVERMHGNGLLKLPIYSETLVGEKSTIVHKNC